jgi:hypothetical protein
VIVNHQGKGAGAAGRTVDGFEARRLPDEDSLERIDLSGLRSEKASRHKGEGYPGDISEVHDRGISVKQFSG